MAPLTMHVPDILRGYEGDLQRALATPLLMTWDDRETFHNAEQPAAIAKVILPPVHSHLLNANIAYVFKKEMKTRSRRILGKAGKAGSKIEFFAGFDFVIEFNWEEWLIASNHQRVALVDHELCHFGREEDEKTGATKWVLVEHDVEEFGAIVNRWGLWKSDLMAFAGAVVHAQQLGMFEGPSRD